MSENRRILLVGDIFVDVSLKDREEKMRLGGVLHAARALWALDCRFDLGYFAPTYLDQSVLEFWQSHSIDGSIAKFGNVTGSPNVMLVADMTEHGDQGYLDLLRDTRQVSLFPDWKEGLDWGCITDILVISGSFPVAEVLDYGASLGKRIHLDIANGDEGNKPERQLDTLFISTSSKIFDREDASIAAKFQSQVGQDVERIILKENRGGSRMWQKHKDVHQVGAQLRRVVHSVGVGDVFAAAFVQLLDRQSTEGAHHFASWIATNYAETTFPLDFRTGVQQTLSLTALEVSNLGGAFLPWEIRRDISIYIAAPDFDYVDRTEIDRVASSLKYHNFRPRLPVRENGQACTDLPKKDRKKMCIADRELIEECAILIAVIINQDPGTHIEIGYAAAKQMPVIVYDPHFFAQNLMLTELPDAVVHSASDLMQVVFEMAAKINSNTAL